MEEAPPARKLEILLVEDNETDIKLTLRAFQKSEIQNNLFVVRSGQAALDFIMGKGEYQDRDKYPCPDIILMDIRMPVMEGLEALRIIKEHPVYRQIPVAILTTSKNEHDVISSFMLGAVSYIQKPVSFDTFVELINGFNYYWSVVNSLPPKPAC
jgi:two-component system, response regulator